MDKNVDTEGFQSKMKLKEMRVAHRDLDDVIDRLVLQPDVDQLRLRRLKKQKLLIKDRIARLESALIPDLNA